MDFDDVVVKDSPGLCRCCLSEGCYKDLGTEYSWMGETEIYADMLLECFDISITQHIEGPNGPNRLICEVCITRLRDACNFKKQVNESEKKFVDMVGRGDFRNKLMVYDMKVEPVQVPAEGLDVEYLDELDFGDDTEDILKTDTEAEGTSEDITALALPVKRGRGRPRKHPVTIKPEKKSKIPKEEKARSSKSLTKGTEDTDARGQLRSHRRTVYNILHNTTIMPFKWFSNKYMCCFCGLQFSESTEMQNHNKNEHENAELKTALERMTFKTTVKMDITVIKCKLCELKMERLDEVIKHLAAHGMIMDDSTEKYLMPFKLSDERMSCQHCGMDFKFFSTLLVHTYKHNSRAKKFLCEICGQGFLDQSQVASHVRSSHKSKEKDPKKSKRNTLHRCKKCEGSFPTKYTLKQHLASVHDVKEFQNKCRDCDLWFICKSRLDAHSRRVHVKEKSKICQICGAKLFDACALKLHMVKHSQDRPFECEFCKKSFQRKKTLEFHRRIHTNDKRYVCKDCGQAFVQTASLKLHYRVHHSDKKTS